ncbi:MAG TPA: CBS domain-containing protein [Stellaceae bacterium]|nr:CBS domain-containing protein [Stellaceae bacterium]
MKIAELMTSPVVTIRPETSIAEAARLMLDRHVSGLPVVNAEGALVGILTEGDLIRRVELGTEPHRPRWVEFFGSTGRHAEEYVLTHGRKAGEIMTSEVVTIGEDASLTDAVSLMDKRHIKRLPVLAGGRVIGIVSRSDLVRALASLSPGASPAPATDAAIRARLRSELAAQNWVPKSVTFKVRGGVVDLQGVLFDDRCRGALRVLAENVPGVTKVEDRMIWVEPMTGIAIIDPVAAPSPPVGS